MSKQRIDYRPNIKYTPDYQTDGIDINEQNIDINTQRNKQPLDTQSVPEIEDNISYLDSIIKFLPADLSMAIKEVYDPVRDIFYNTLIDKIVDPNPHKPEIIIKPDKPSGGGDKPDKPPNGGDKPGSDPDNNKNIVHPIILRPIKGNDKDDNDYDSDNKNIYPIILHPINLKDPDKDPDSGQKPDEDNKDKVIHPIILKPILDSTTNPDDEDDNDNIESPYPIILYPIYEYTDDDNNNNNNFNDDDDEDNDNNNKDDNNKDKDNDDDNDDENDEGDIGLWDPPNMKIKYLYPELNDAIDREFVYLLTKLLKHYTGKLKDILNNYYFNTMRQYIEQDEENIKFISNKLKVTSNDILNHSKHLLDSSVKNENVAALRTEFFINVFTIRDTAIHIRSFYVSHELRKRYTNIKYSKGRSMANSMSDSILTKLHAQYELQYRRDFENLFRYLESSLKVTEDILRLYIQDGLSKSTIIKKGGIK